MNTIKCRLTTYWLSARSTFALVFLNADTTTIRLLLAWASFNAGVSLLIDDDKFNAPEYAIVRGFGDEQMWALYFLLHWAGVHWRIFERSRSRPHWALVINAWGFAIWFVSTAALVWTSGDLGIATAMSWTLCVASAWALYRTGLSKDAVSL